MFKSAALPCKFYFRRADGDGGVDGEDEDQDDLAPPFYKVIFKVGNDLRLDQFALQMINLFNRIFLESGLDLKITPYKVLATSATCGRRRNILLCMMKRIAILYLLRFRRVRGISVGLGHQLPARQHPEVLLARVRAEESYTGHREQLFQELR